MKPTTIFACSKCGAQYPKWQGRCLDCGNWGTLKEELSENKKTEEKTVWPDQTISLAGLKNEIIKEATTIKELDNVLGGGITKGSFILLGGDPGIGKTTLAMQIADKLTNTLYVSGEESAQQIKNRAERLKMDLKQLNFLGQTNIDKIISNAKQKKPDLLIIDSIQTVYSDETSGSPGSVSQITACAAKLMELAKNNSLTIIIIGHVTKDGLVAGPKTLEHLVDVVLYLENDDQHYYKILRTVKNRFGVVGEIGVFEMTAAGLQELTDAAGLFLDKNLDGSKPGIATTIIIEGSRPFLIEIQSLINKTAFGYPVRKSNGFDLNRLQMILAVLAKYCQVNFASYDVYLNIAGGLKTKDTAVDMAVILSLLSSYLEKPLPPKTIAIGEIGLSGEIRAVSQIEKRLKEADKFGFQNCLIPNIATVNYDDSKKIKSIKQLAELINNFDKKQ